MTRNCMIGQSGGPTAAINASLAGVIAQAKESGFEHIYGLKNGIKGLLEDTYFELKDFDEQKLTQLKHTPAMYLGSCRYKLPEASHDVLPYQKIFGMLQGLNITDFFYIGGNDSMDTVMKLSAYAKEHNYPINIIGIPKTIDNDLMGTDHTPGFGSAAKYVATSLLEIIHDSHIYKVKSVTIVEIMGRNAGWLTAASALARNGNQTAPDYIYLPEVTFDKTSFLNDIEKLFATKNNIIVAVSEGIRTADGKFLDEDDSASATDVFGHAIHSGTGKILENLVKDHFGCKVRSIELNVLQRCAMHLASQTDIEEAFMIGKEAVKASLNGLTEKMMVYKREEPYHISVDALNVKDIANLEKKIPLEWINEQHNDIKQELYDYLYPLIQGEVALEYKNGIPCYLDISHLM